VHQQNLYIWPLIKEAYKALRGGGGGGGGERERERERFII
jgi:hypothetical protein